MAANVLVVDDDPNNLDMLSRRLANQGFRVLSAASGTEALQAIGTEPVDLVLLDIMMPVVSGLDVLAAIRRLPGSPRHLPIVMVTAKTDSADMVQALEAGASDYVTKPIDFHVLVARIRTQLARTAAERTQLARQRQRDLQQAQRLSTVGQLAVGVAHDFNNDLTIIQGYAEMLRTGLPTDDPRSDYLDQILRSTDRATGLSRQLLSLSRRRPVQARVVNLAEIVAGMRTLLERLLGVHVRLAMRHPEDLWPVKIDAGQLEQVVLNLAANARDAMPDGGTLELVLSNVAAPPSGHEPAGEWVSLVVRDTGCGMDPETQAHIFEPFFTTKSSAKGTGLGLTIVHGIVQQHGGRVDVQSSSGGGTTFSILLPRTQERFPLEARAGDRRTKAMPGTILIAEDQDAVRVFVRVALERSGYQVLEAARGDEALELAQRYAGTIDVLLSDLVMPGLSGALLWSAVAATRPETRCLFMSGHVGDQIDPDLRDPDVPVLQKPFSTTDLVSMIEHVRVRNEGADPAALT